MESWVMRCVKYILMRQAHKYILPKLRRSGTLRNCWFQKVYTSPMGSNRISFRNKYILTGAKRYILFRSW